MDPSTTDSDRLIQGSWIAGYRIEEMLGRGGMGEVYLAHDERLGRDVALKRIRPDRLLSDEAHRRFRREARLAARVDHPAVVRIHDLLEHDSGDFLVLELVEGRSLADMAASGGADLETELGWLAQVARGLTAMHDLGLVHRDVKVENVLVSSAGNAKILDFGLARSDQGSAEESLTRDGAVFGTVRTMSPEQARGEVVDHRSDLYSLGVLAWELLARRPLFGGGSALETARRVLDEKPPPLADVRADVPEAVALLVARLLSKDPEGRPRSAQQVAALFEAARAGLETRTGASDDPPFQPGWSRLPTGMDVGGDPTRSGSTGTKKLLGILVPVVVLLVVGWVLWRSVGNPPAAPLRVAVLDVVVDSAGGEQDPGATAEGVHTVAEDEARVVKAVSEATLAALANRRGVSVVDPSQVRALTGGSTNDSVSELARALAADAVVTQRLEPRGVVADLTLRRFDAAGSLQWTTTLEIPLARRELLLVTDAVSFRWQKAFPEHPPRNPAKRNLEPETYARWLDLSLESTTGAVAGDRQDMRRRAAALAREAPEFLEAQLLAADLSLHGYSVERQDALLDDARRFLDAAEAVAPEDPRLPLRRFQFHLVEGDLDAAAGDLDRLERLAPGDVAVEVARARLAERRGDLRLAAERLQQAADRYPSWTVLYRLAELESKLGEVDRAREHLEQLLAADPDNGWGLRSLGNLELQYGDLEVAAARFQQLIEQRPRFQYWTNLGLARYLQRRYDEAVEAHREAEALAPGQPYVWLNLADAESARGRHDEAAAYHRKVREHYRSSPPQGIDELVLAQSLAYLGQRREAAELAHQTLRTLEENSEAAYLAAVVFAQVGDKTSAEVWARKALDLGMTPRWLETPPFEGIEVRAAPP